MKNRKNVLWNALGGITGIAGNFLLFPIALRAIGAETYGVWLICFTSAALLVQADLGLGSAVVRILAHERSGLAPSREASFRRTSWTLFLGLSLTLPIIMCLALWGYFSIASSAPAKAPVVDFVAISAISLCIGLIGRFFSAVLQSHGRFDFERQGAVIGVLVRGAIVISASVWNLGPNWIAIAESLGIIVPALTCVVVALRRGNASMRLASKSDVASVGRELVAFSGAVFASSFSSLVAVQAPIYVIGAVLGPAGSVVYSAALRVYQSARMAYGWVTGPELPVVAKLNAEGRHADVAAIHARLMLACAGLAGVATAVVGFQASDLLGVWLGSEYAKFGAVLQIIGICLMFAALTAPGIVISAGAGRPGVVVVPNALWAIATVGFSVPLTAIGGVTGAAVALALPLVILFPWYQRATAKVTGLKFLRLSPFIVAVLLLPWVPAFVLEFVPLQPILAIAATAILSGLAGVLGFTWAWRRYENLIAGRVND